MNILVTGSSGFIGSILLTTLDYKRYSVRAIDKHTSTCIANDNLVQFSGNLTDKNLVNELCENIDCIIHLAGEANVRSRKADLLNNNSVASEYLINSALFHGVKKFIYLSTAKSGLNNDYALSKESVEKLLVKKSVNNAMTFTIIQSGAVFGSGMKNGLAKWLRMYKYLYFPRLPSSHAQIEMISVSDLCEIILRCMDNPATDNKIFKVNDCQSYSINKIDQACMTVMGRKNNGYKAPRYILFLLALIGSGLNKVGVNLFYNFDTHKLLFDSKMEIDKTLFDVLDFYPKKTFYSELNEILR